MKRYSITYRDHLINVTELGADWEANITPEKSPPSEARPPLTVHYVVSMSETGAVDIAKQMIDAHWDGPPEGHTDGHWDGPKASQ